MSRETVGDEVRSGDLTVEGSVSFAGGTDLSTALAAKAPLASPTFTGTPAAPTAAAGTNTTQVATTAFVQAELANVDALPSQTGHSGEYLTTDGTNASWAPVSGGTAESTFTNNFMLMGA